MRTITQSRLYGILDLGYVTRANALPMLEAMLQGGVDLVQIRAKGDPESVILELARAALPLTRKAGVPLIINDYPALAAEVGADGVHVGQDDLAVEKARTQAAAGRDNVIVGKSTHSLQQAVAALGEKPDYIGFGPLFSTPTKPEYQPIGLETIRTVHEKVKIPVFCIGGVKLENLDPVLEAGARRVVIVSGILQAADVPGYCRAVQKKLAALS